MAYISLKNLRKSYKAGIDAVHHINLEIRDKEFMVLVGPSGCGKTTTLRMIAGLEDVTSGEIWINDRLVNDVPAKDRNIAMVFQNYALYPHMSVFENMAFGLKLRRYPKSEIQKRVFEAAEILGIKSYLNSRPRELSGGERQRAALGRAIVRKPQVFLFDEPLSNLDVKLRVLMRAEIHKLRLRLQATFIYVTHDQTEAMTMGDRVTVMRQGSIQQCGLPMDVYDKPANKFVASFMGLPPVNLITGRIVKKDHKYFFNEGSFQVKLVDDMHPKMAPYHGKEVVMGIRSQDIHDKLFASELLPENTVRAACEVVEPQGPEVYLYLTTGKHHLIARVGAANPPKVNRELDLVFDMSKVHFFDPKTESTII